MKKLPPITRDTMSMKISDQMEFVLFPEKNGQPQIDVIQMKLTQIEGEETSVFMTPCEAMEVIAGLSSAVQFYLYNQEQYRKEVLEPRLDLAEKRSKVCKVCKGKKQIPYSKQIRENGNGKLRQCPACKGSGKQSNYFDHKNELVKRIGRIPQRTHNSCGAP
jgi:hypothetical protein